MENPTRPGLAIKERRRAIGISQEELALRADVSPSLITKIERDSHDLMQMKAENLFRLVSALEWSASEFTECTGLNIPLITESEIQTSSRHIDTYSLTISLNRGEMKISDLRTYIPENWLGEYKALFIAPNRTIIYHITQQISPGDKAVFESEGVVIGKIISIDKDTFVLELDQAFKDKVEILKNPDVLGVVKEERISY